MISISQTYIESIIEKFSDDIKSQRDNAISKLDKISFDGLQQCEKEYLEWVKDEYSKSDFLVMCPKGIQTYIENPLFKKVPRVFSFDDDGNPKKDKDGNQKEEKSKLKDTILNALDYTTLRSDFYPKYFREVGIKACVYCNSSLAVSVDRIDNDGKDDIRAKFQVDHFYPKSDFPMFSISLFNLYPSCASCNNVKNDKMVKFNLYSNISSELENSNFRFKLSAYDEAKYLLYKKGKEIDFDFLEEKDLPKNFYTFQDTFDIKGIYDTQKDLISDLVDKSLVYDFYYKKSLNDNFPKLFLTKEHFERFLLGNYPRVQDIHKRPMSKFMQDIAKDLGIID